ncbi:PREDICTED: HVA22-like protein e [Nelumbo nucifera]|uniref:HVA22-like protein n=1 Tax=Nelumbo nucifera TaxID=4432 RepID=A0A1U8QAB2_NELNU|nr:PREDICTED: HVA22-like protein e [Nelumbo nucifera]
MVFVALLTLLAKIFDLAWPLITLVYPIYSSIIAIESNSNAGNQKWLTYWVLYPLVILFEFVSLKLIEWYLFWPYLKMMAACWLVLPHFSGAAYAYKHIVRPCFLMNPLTLNNWFTKQKGDFVPSGSKGFLVAAKIYIKENGSEEALSKLITRKARHYCRVMHLDAFLLNFSKILDKYP